MSEGQGVAELLSERPELEPAVEAVLAADEPFTFDDLAIDSGAFGELVSAGVVEEEADGYRVVDPQAVRAALDGDSATEPADDSGFDASLPSVPTVDRRVVGALAGALCLVVLLRAYHFGSIFRGGAVVLSGNDPYYYRYWVEQMLSTGGGAFDLSKIEIPDGIQKGEPLLVATLWWLTALLGGATDTAGVVLAWYPVVAAVIVAVLTYLTAVAVTGDRRIGLAAVVLLAVTPGHAMRTSLGFADHHAFDYVWLAVTIYALVVLDVRAESLRDPAAWLAATGVAIGVAAQTLAWEAGPLLLVPVGGYVAVRALFDVVKNRSPLRANAPLVVGLCAAAAAVWFAHTELDWHTELVALAPVLLLGGTVGLLVVAELVFRLDLPTEALVGLEILGVPLGFVVLRSLEPGYITRLQGELARLGAERNIAETRALLNGDTFGWLLLFGFVLVLALPYLVWASVETYRQRPVWIVPVVYGWYLLALASIQVRFVGQLAPMTAVFGGIGFVHLGERVDLVRPPLPFDRDATAADGGPPGTAASARGQSGVRTFEVPTPRSAGALIALFLLIGGLGIIQTPVKISQVTVDGPTYQTARWIDGYAASGNDTDSRDYVFSQWSRNRVYNYFVSGDSKSYAFARQYYASFVTSTNLSAWTKRLRQKVDFVVTADGVNLGPETLYSRLHEHYGSRTEAAAGVGNFRAVYATPEGSRKVFEPVTGAVLTWDAATNDSVTVRTRVSIPNAEFTYTRHTTVENGRHEVRVAYPGTYTIVSGAADGRTVTVNESAVTEGTRIQVGS